MFTQPVMYKKIKGHPSTREIYADRLIKEGLLTADQVANEVSAFEIFLDQAFEDGKTLDVQKADWLDGEWKGFKLPQDDDRRGKTGVSQKRLKALGAKFTTIPDGVTPHRTLKRVIDARAKAISSGKGLDWAAAEHLAFATLLDEGYPVRLSGQDCGRGTFSQRHSHVVDQNTNERHTLLNTLSDTQAPYEVIDSLLSEEAVLGYEYGYSLADPNTLTLWEPNSVTSQMARRFSSTSSSLRLNANGCACRASSCSCHTAMKAKARNTPPRASNASSR